ncbi:MAG: hypothetical protein HXX09_12665 [Bacteroidetes bacterium]|nr:hypothetical protein [Bacteroidota bacterium]
MMFGFDDHLIVYVYNNYLLKLKPDGKKKSIFPFLDSSLFRKLADTFGMTWSFMCLMERESIHNIIGITDALSLHPKNSL